MGQGDRWGWWRSRPQSATAAVWHFRVERERGAVGRLNDTLEQTLRTRVPEPALRALQIALDELLTNVIMHAEQAAGSIDVQVSRDRSALATTISYLADEFDPTVWKPRVAAADIASAHVGGLGIQLVRSLMDEFAYAHEAGMNVVTLRKRC